MVVHVSVVVTTNDVDVLPPMIPGADEILMVGGRGALARNAGAKVAHGRILVFIEDWVRLEGAFWELRHPPKRRNWWTVKAYVNATKDKHTSHVCAGASLCAACGLPSGSIGPFQAVRSTVFHELGGYRPTETGYDWDLSLRLAQRGEVLHRIHAVAHVLEPLRFNYAQENPMDPKIRRVAAELAEVPWMAP